MTTNQYLPFSELASRLELYERLPVLLSQNLRTNIYRGTAANAITIAFGTLGAKLLTAISYNWSGLFTPTGRLHFPLDIAQFLSGATHTIGDYLAPLNALSLVIIALVFWRSRTFTQPISEAYHWLLGAAMIPAAIGVLATALIATAFVVNIVIAIAIWILLFIFILLILVVVFFILALVLAVSAG